MTVDAKLRALASERLSAVVKRGGEAYERHGMLPRLLPIDPTDLETATPALTRRICLLLARALRAERTRGRAGHWSYDLNRHLGLLQAYRAERAALTRETDAARRASRPLRGATAETQAGRDVTAAPRKG